MPQQHDCKEELRSAGSKATPGRLAILRLLERADKPLTVVQIGQGLKALNQVTLYRVLEALTRAGLVRKGIGEKAAHFEYAGRPHHHHLVCADCGFIKNCQTC